MYTVIVPRPVHKSLAKLSPSDGRRVLAVIAALAQNPRPPGCLKLRDRPGWRVRAGNYRIIYDVDDAQQMVTIRAVDDRSSVYR